MKAMDQAISVRGLRKTYADVEAVAGVDFEVARGEIFALLGPNGAGKTSVLEILEGFRERTAGEVAVLGTDPSRGGRAWRDRIGIVLQESQPDPGLTVREAMSLYAGYYERPLGIDETLARVGLEKHAGRVATTLSGGQRRRLDVALAIVGDPELLFLDEPTTGFDPSARRDAWEMIGGLRAAGTTIILTTHYLDEAERLADRIAVMVAGRIVAQGTPATLGGRNSAAAFVTLRLPQSQDADSLPAEIRSRIENAVDGVVRFRAATPLRDVELIAAWARENDVNVSELDVRQPQLEDVYLELIRSEAVSS